LILEELTRCGVEVVFLCNPLGHGPEENLLLQVQGMIAEYERAKILERCRRGKQYAARHGSVNVLSGAPYGYRYISKHEGGGQARYQVIADEARVVRRIFAWVGQERSSLGEVCRQLQRDGVLTRTGKSAWDRPVIWLILPRALPEQETTADPARRQRPGRLVICGALWRCALLTGGMDLVGYGIQSWLPTYLISVRHVGITVTGALVTVLGVASAAAVLVGGVLFDRFAHLPLRRLVVPPLVL